MRTDVLCLSQLTSVTLPVGDEVEQRVATGVVRAECAALGTSTRKHAGPSPRVATADEKRHSLVRLLQGSKVLGSREGGIL